MRYLPFLIVCLGLMMSGCSKDDDDYSAPGSSNGNSGGTNNSGPEKVGCQKASKTCQNGGKCLEDGSCDCSNGYKGDYCENEKQPSSIEITKIKVRDWPFYTNNGEEWDYWSCCPEMYVELVNNAEVTKLSANHVDDANKGKTYTYTSDLPYQVVDVSSEYTLELWDYDESSADDYMGGVYFTFYNEGNDFPNSLEISAGGITYEVEVNYNFN